MTAGFITGALLGGLLFGVIPNLVLIRTLALLLIMSAVKLWRHGHRSRASPCFSLGEGASD